VSRSVPIILSCHCPIVDAHVAVSAAARFASVHLRPSPSGRVCTDRLPLCSCRHRQDNNPSRRGWTDKTFYVRACCVFDDVCESLRPHEISKTIDEKVMQLGRNMVNVRRVCELVTFDLDV